MEVFCVCVCVCGRPSRSVFHRGRQPAAATEEGTQWATGSATPLSRVPWGFAAVCKGPWWMRRGVLATHVHTHAHTHTQRRDTQRAHTRDHGRVRVRGELSTHHGQRQASETTMIFRKEGRSPSTSSLVRQHRFRPRVALPMGFWGSCVDTLWWFLLLFLPLGKEACGERGSVSSLTEKRT